MSNSASQDEVDNTDNNTAPVSSGSVCQDQSCNVICNAEPRKPPKKQISVLCRAWKFRYVAPCTTNSPAAFEKNITTMLEINRPKNIIYLVVLYDARQLPQDLNPTKVTIQGFLQGKLWSSTLRKWNNFEWSPVQGGLCGDLEFENFSEAAFPYITVPVFGTDGQAGSCSGRAIEGKKLEWSRIARQNVAKKGMAFGMIVWITNYL